MIRRPVFAAPGLLFLLFLAGYLSFIIDSRLNRANARFPLEDALSRILGGAKEAVGDTLFLKADSYYHGGTPEKFDEEPEGLEKEGHIEGGGKEKAPNDWVARVNYQVRSHEHVHLTGEEQKEMLPFFAMAIDLDPHNIEAILTAAYWLDRHIGKVGDAIQVLKKGLENNPDSWEINAQLAGIYFRRKQDYVLSEHYYLEAVKRGANGLIERKELMNIYYYLGESYARGGKGGEAVSAYQSALKIFDREKDPAPWKDAIEAKIKALSS